MHQLNFISNGLKLLVLILLMTLSGVASSSDIVFFNQDCNVDLAGADNTCADERSNLLALLRDSDDTILVVSSFDDSNLSLFLPTSDVLVIPDLEDQLGDCDINDPLFLSTSAKSIIADFVTNGGDIIVTGSIQNIAFINDVFGLSLMSQGNSSTSVSTKNDTAAENTPFESCPGELPNLSATFLVTSSMPDDKRCIYETGGFGSVAYFPFGAGGIIYLGFDFNDAGPGCSASGSDWITCVLPAAEAVVESGIEIPSTVPTLSQWMIIILGLIILTVGVVSIRERWTMSV